MLASAFLFDLDGTLIDSERQNAESIARVLGARGRPLSEEERVFVVGHGWREIYHYLAERGIDLGFDELKSAAAEERVALAEVEGLAVLPGAVEFVRTAARHGPCVIVSGSSRREVGYCIGKLGLDGAIPWFIAAEDVSCGKPAPDGYLAAAARLAVAPRDCIVFEDSAAGIAAAKAAGMRCVAVSAANFLGQDQAGADFCVAHLGELGDRLWGG